MNSDTSPFLSKNPLLFLFILSFFLLISSSSSSDSNPFKFDRCHYKVEVVRIVKGAVKPAELRKWWGVQPLKFPIIQCMRCAVLDYYMPFPIFKDIDTDQYGGYCDNKREDPFKTFVFLDERDSPCCFLSEIHRLSKSVSNAKIKKWLDPLVECTTKWKARKKYQGHYQKILHDARFFSVRPTCGDPKKDAEVFRHFLISGVKPIITVSSGPLSSDGYRMEQNLFELELGLYNGSDASDDYTYSDKITFLAPIPYSLSGPRVRVRVTTSGFGNVETPAVKTFYFNPFTGSYSPNKKKSLCPGYITAANPVSASGHPALRVQNVAGVSVFQIVSGFEANILVFSSDDFATMIWQKLDSKAVSGFSGVCGIQEDFVIYDAVALSERVVFATSKGILELVGWYPPKKKTSVKDDKKLDELKSPQNYSQSGVLYMTSRPTLRLLKDEFSKSTFCVKRLQVLPQAGFFDSIVGVSNDGKHYVSIFLNTTRICLSCDLFNREVPHVRRPQLIDCGRQWNESNERATTWTYFNCAIHSKRDSKTKTDLTVFADFEDNKGRDLCQFLFSKGVSSCSIVFGSRLSTTLRFAFVFVVSDGSAARVVLYKRNSRLLAMPRPGRGAWSVTARVSIGADFDEDQVAFDGSLTAMDALIRLNTGKGIVSVTWTGFEMKRIEYPVNVGGKPIPLKMVAYVSTPKGVFCWLAKAASGFFVLVADPLTDLHLWTDLSDPIFLTLIRLKRSFDCDKPVGLTQDDFGRVFLLCDGGGGIHHEEFPLDDMWTTENLAAFFANEEAESLAAEEEENPSSPPPSLPPTAYNRGFCPYARVFYEIEPYAVATRNNHWTFHSPEAWRDPPGYLSEADMLAYWTVASLPLEVLKDQNLPMDTDEKFWTKYFGDQKGMALFHMSGRGYFDLAKNISNFLRYKKVQAETSLFYTDVFYLNRPKLTKTLAAFPENIWVIESVISIKVHAVLDNINSFLDDILQKDLNLPPLSENAINSTQEGFKSLRIETRRKLKDRLRDLDLIVSTSDATLLQFTVQKVVHLENLTIDFLVSIRTSDLARSIIPQQAPGVANVPVEVSLRLTEAGFRCPLRGERLSETESPFLGVAKTTVHIGCPPDISVRINRTRLKSSHWDCIDIDDEGPPIGYNPAGVPICLHSLESFQPQFYFEQQSTGWTRLYDDKFTLNIIGGGRNWKELEYWTPDVVMKSNPLCRASAHQKDLFKPDEAILAVPESDSSSSEIPLFPDQKDRECTVHNQKIYDGSLENYFQFGCEVSSLDCYNRLPLKWFIPPVYFFLMEFSNIGIAERFPSCDFTFRFPIRVHFVKVPLLIRVFIIVGATGGLLFIVSIYMIIHWNNRCRKWRERRRRRREEAVRSGSTITEPPVYKQEEGDESDDTTAAGAD